MATPVRYRNGLIGTTVFHGLLLLLMLLCSLHGIFPPPAEKGILVDFGNSNTGMGAFEPRFSEQALTAPVQTAVSSSAPEDAVLTQSIEDAPAVRTEPERGREPARTSVREPAARPQTATAAQPAPERTVDSRALFPARGAMESTAAGEGIAGGSGNQGVPTGAPDAGVYGEGGDAGGGNSFVLTGRTLIGSLPSPDFPGQKDGIVVISITVDSNGKVIDARYTQRGSTTLDEQLVAAARKAAMATRFSTAPEDPVQRGTIRYTFRLTDK